MRTGHRGLFPALSVLALTSLTACRPSYDEARAACGYAPGQYLPPFRAISWGDHDAGIPNRFYMGMSRRCSATMGDALNLDWESFHTHPRALPNDEQPKDTATSITLGMTYLVATDFGSIHRYEQFPSKPPSLQRFLENSLRSARSDARLGDVLYRAILESIVRVDANLIPMSYRVDATYNAGHVAYSTQNIDLAEVEAGNTLLHEALHSQVGHSLNCQRLANSAYSPDGGQYGPTFETCDQTMDGANGGVATLYWLAAQTMREQVDRAYQANEIDVKEESEFSHFISEILYEGQVACRNICDLGNSPACAETRARRIEDGQGVCEMQGDIPVFVNRTKTERGLPTSPP